MDIRIAEVQQLLEDLKRKIDNDETDLLEVSFVIGVAANQLRFSAAMDNND